MNLTNGLTTPAMGFLGLNFVFKLLFFVILVGYALYAFLLLLRVRILSDTVETPQNKLIQLIASAHLALSLIGGFLAMILVLLA